MPKVAKIEVKEEELKRTKKLMEEMELKRLQREDKNNNRNASFKDAATEKQQKVVNALKKENDNLISNLTVMQSQRQCLVDAKHAEEISDLFSQGDKLDEEIACEKKYIVDLTEQINKESARLERLRRMVKSGPVSDFQLVEQNQRAERSLEAWKSRLHAEQVQLSTSIKEDADMRKKIALLLNGKSHFNQLSQELMKKLTQGKRIMKEVIEQTATIYKRRDEVARKIQALKDKDAADLAKRQEEMQDLQMRLSEDMHLSVFKQKVMSMRLKLSDGAKATRRASQAGHAMEEKLRMLIDAWYNVRQFTGLSECLDVCDLIDRTEAENFSLYQYNNEVRDQLEALTERTISLFKKVDEEQQLAVEYDERQEMVLSRLEQELGSLEAQTHDAKDQKDASERVFERLLQKIRALFDMLKCDTWPLQQLLGENDEVTEFNYKLYLNEIESQLLVIVGEWRPTAARVSDDPTLMTNDGENIIGSTSTHTTTGQRGKISNTKSQHYSMVPTQRSVVAVLVNKKPVTRPCPDCECIKSKQRRFASVTSR